MFRTLNPTPGEIRHRVNNDMTVFLSEILLIESEEYFMKQMTGGWIVRIDFIFGILNLN